MKHRIDKLIRTYRMNIDKVPKEQLLTVYRKAYLRLIDDINKASVEVVDTILGVHKFLTEDKADRDRFAHDMQSERARLIGREGTEALKRGDADAYWRYIDKLIRFADEVYLPYREKRHVYAVLGTSTILPYDYINGYVKYPDGEWTKADWIAEMDIPLMKIGGVIHERP